jgi:aryl-alcohol dehydrogenase-like predicted oxidoreductase
MAGAWGESSAESDREAVSTALESGITLIDTAEVYGEDGYAERTIRAVLDERSSDERIYVPTKAPGGDVETIESHMERSIDRLGEPLDVLQLHCPPTETFYRPDVFDALERWRAEGRIRHYGASVRTVEEARKAIEYPGVETIQLIFNPFRVRPAERFFDEALCQDVGVIVRVPLASGLLANAFDSTEEFDPDDHRAEAAREGVEAGAGGKGGETFAGVPFEAGLIAVEELRPHVPEGWTMAQFTLRWILDHEAVSTVIPGSTTPEHVRENAAAADLDPLSHQTHGAVRDVYEEHVREHVHHRW